jgi:hypothetical protein
MLNDFKRERLREREKERERAEAWSRIKEKVNNFERERGEEE